MVTPNIKAQAVSLINSYVNIHKEMEELEKEIDKLNLKKEEVISRLSETRVKEKELITLLNENSDKPFNLTEFISTL